MAMKDDSENDNDEEPMTTQDERGSMEMMFLRMLQRMQMTITRSIELRVM